MTDFFQCGTGDPSKPGFKGVFKLSCHWAWKVNYATNSMFKRHLEDIVDVSLYVALIFVPFFLKLDIHKMNRIPHPLSTSFLDSTSAFKS